MSETIEQPQTSGGEDLDAILGDAYDAMMANAEATEGKATDRDDRGRFAARSDGDADEKTDETTDAERGTPAIEAPSSWSDADKAHWNTLSREAQDAITRRERDVEKALQEQAAERSRIDPINQTIEPYRDKWAVNGVKPEQAIGQLLAAQDALTRNFDAALPELIRAFGRDPLQTAQAILGQSQAPGNVQASAVDFRDPRLDAVLEELQQAKVQEVSARISAFASDPAHVHFEDVRQDMGKLIQIDPTMALKDAYDRAVWSNPKTREKMLAQARLNAPAKEQPRARSVSVRDAPTSAAGSRNVDRSKMTTEDILNEAWEQHAR
jgi:hypothetical protein